MGLLALTARGLSRTASGETFENASTKKQPTSPNPSERAVWGLIPHFWRRQWKNALTLSSSHRQTFSVPRDMQRCVPGNPPVPCQPEQS